MFATAPLFTLLRRSMLGAALLLPLAAQAQSFDPSSSLLSLPSLSVAGATYQLVVVKLDQISIAAVDNATVKAQSVPSFDLSNNLLSLPSINANGVTYYGLVVKLEKFSVVSVGSSGNSGAANSSGFKTGACSGSGTTLSYDGKSGPFTSGDKVCAEGNGSTTLTLGGKALGNPKQNTAVTAPYAAYRFSDSGSNYSYETVLNNGSLYEINVMSGDSFVGQLFH